MEQQHGEGLELLNEPRRERRPLLRRDVLLGLLLLLAVIGWGGWDWWQQEGRFASYRAGLRYVQQHDWEAARAAFLTAAGYRDAAQQATIAAQRIAERDARYAAASRSAQ